MADGDVVADDEWMVIVCNMQHAKILDVCTSADTDIIHIATDHGVEPHTAILPHDHITDDHTSFLDKAGFRDCGLDTLKGPNHGGTVGESAYFPQGSH